MKMLSRIFVIQVILPIACSFCMMSCENDDVESKTLKLIVPPVALSKLKYLTPYNISKPTFTYWCMHPQEKILACVDGTIVNILLNENADPQLADYEIHLQPHGSIDWLLVIDHVKDMIVTKGQFVIAGEQIASVGTHAYVELQINNEKENTTYCPLTVGSDYFIRAHEQVVYYEDFNFYNEEKNDVSECTPTLVGVLCE